MLRVFFGNPGCGKTTLAVKMAKQNLASYEHTFVNFEHKVVGCAECDLQDLGDWTFPASSYIAIDEAGIEYNSRAYKSLAQNCIRWFKKHRHYRCDVDVFSQSWEDMDVTLRRLAVELWYVYRIGPFSLSRRIYKRVTVDKNTEQIIDGYRMASLLWLLIWPLQTSKLPLFAPKFTLTYRPKYYELFDSYSKDDIPVKEFPVYGG